MSKIIAALLITLSFNTYAESIRLSCDGILKLQNQETVISDEILTLKSVITDHYEISFLNVFDKTLVEKTEKDYSVAFDKHPYIRISLNRYNLNLTWRQSIFDSATSKAEILNSVAKELGITPERAAKSFGNELVEFNGQCSLANKPKI